MKTLKHWIYWIFGTFGVFLMTLTLSAQEEEGGGQEEAQSLWDILSEGGFIALLIALLSIVAVTLVVKYIIDFQKDKVLPPEIVGEVDRLLQEEEYEEALSLCEMEPSVFTNIVAEGIAKIGMGKDEVERALDKAKKAEKTRLEGQISWLSLIGNIAPMVGLFGTVFGMITAFRQIAQKSNPTPSELAGGIYTALVTTALGLALAIPVLACYFYFRNRLSSLMNEVELIIEDIFSQFRY